MTQPYELIPTNHCPFCGGKSKITCVRRGNYSRKGDNYQGLCNKCKARGPLVQDDPQLAADKWNALGGEVKEIPMAEGSLKREPYFQGGPMVWNLYKSWGLVRHLDEFEAAFVDAALKARHVKAP